MFPFWAAAGTGLWVEMGTLLHIWGIKGLAKRNGEEMFPFEGLKWGYLGVEMGTFFFHVWFWDEKKNQTLKMFPFFGALFCGAMNKDGVFFLVHFVSINVFILIVKNYFWARLVWRKKSRGVKPATRRLRRCFFISRYPTAGRQYMWWHISFLRNLGCVRISLCSCRLAGGRVV
jgi:hypothetical protein